MAEEKSGCQRAKQISAVACAGFVIVVNLIMIITALLVILILPVSVPLLVRGSGNLCLGLLMLCVELGWMKRTVASLFGFTRLRIGRAIFWFYMGSNSLVFYSEDQGVLDSLLSIASYVTFFACAFVGFCELCSKSTRSSADVPEAQTFEPQADGGVSINLSSSQVKQAGKFAMSNAACITQTVGAAAASASSSKKSENPFFSKA